MAERTMNLIVVEIWQYGKVIFKGNSQEVKEHFDFSSKQFARLTAMGKAVQKGSTPRPQTMYADPPYLHETRKSKHYTNEMDNTQHVELLKALKNHKGPVILSGYESDLYNTELFDWWKMTFEQQVGITTKKKRTATEVLWFNFEPSGQMNLFEEAK